LDQHGELTTDRKRRSSMALGKADEKSDQEGDPGPIMTKLVLKLKRATRILKT
jgi:hypothetical protein